jgi:hypothetical protein
MHDGAALEADLELRRMHVHVHRARRHAHDEHHGGIPSLHDQRLVPVEHRMGEDAIAHPAHATRRGRREPDVCPEQACTRHALARRPEQPGDRDAALLGFDLDEAPAALGAEHLDQTLAERADRRPVEQLARVGNETEARLRRRDRETGETVDHVTDLGRGRAKELPARRRGREQVGDRDRRARRARLRTGGTGAVRVGVDRAPDRVVVAARHHPHAAGGRDARQRLAAEAERPDAREVVDARELTRRVTREGEQRVVRMHPGAVVDDGDRVDAAGRQAYLDLPRAGVERVLDQLLHDRRGPLDDLARGDLALHLRRQDGDASHGAHLTRSGARPCAPPTRRRPRAVPRGRGGREARR